MAMWRKAIAELIGTAALIFIGAGSIVMNQYTNGGVGLVGIALAHGLTIGVMVSCVGHISGGHLNPAVTAGFLATGRMSLRDGVWYIGSQLIGGVLGAVLLQACFPPAALAAANFGTPLLAPGVSVSAGVIIELVLTFLLVFTVFATAVDPQGAFKSIAGYGIGTIVTIDILAGGPLTGASMNPARTFGPAVVGNIWTHHLVYWVGPIAGGVLAGLLYHNLFLHGRRK